MNYTGGANLPTFDSSSFKGNQMEDLTKKETLGSIFLSFSLRLSSLPSLPDPRHHGRVAAFDAIVSLEELWLVLEETLAVCNISENIRL